MIKLGLVETRRYTGWIDETRRSIEAILRAVERTRDLAQQIKRATHQQMQASSQVTEAMRQVVVSLGAAGAEGPAVNLAAEDLRQMAIGLGRLDGAERPMG